MIAVIFEGIVQEDRKDAYLDAAARLRPLPANIDGAPEDSRMSG